MVVIWTDLMTLNTTYKKMSRYGTRAHLTCNLRIKTKNLLAFTFQLAFMIVFASYISYLFYAKNKP